MGRGRLQPLERMLAKKRTWTPLGVVSTLGPVHLPRCYSMNRVRYTWDVEIGPILEQTSKIETLLFRHQKSLLGSTHTEWPANQMQASSESNPELFPLPLPRAATDTCPGFCENPAEPTERSEKLGVDRGIPKELFDADKLNDDFWAELSLLFPFEVNPVPPVGKLERGMMRGEGLDPFSFAFNFVIFDISSIFIFALPLPEEAIFASIF